MILTTEDLNRIVLDTLGEAVAHNTAGRAHTLYIYNERGPGSITVHYTEGDTDAPDVRLNLNGYTPPVKAGWIAQRLADATKLAEAIHKAAKAQSSKVERMAQAVARVSGNVPTVWKSETIYTVVKVALSGHVWRVDMEWLEGNDLPRIYLLREGNGYSTPIAHLSLEDARILARALDTAAAAVELIKDGDA